MDKALIIPIGIIASFFVIFCIVILLNVIKFNVSMKKSEAKMPTKRKIIKRKDTNVYEIKTSRGK